MSVLDTAEYRRLALIAAGVDPCDIPCILDTATWRRLMLAALYDLSQGGGGSPGYINGSVRFYADLPVTAGTPAVNTAYLVRENSGVWFINRRPAGIYVRLFNFGNLDDWDYAGAFPEVNDSQYFRIYDSADPTKEIAFSASGITAGATRTLTVPNASGTLALTTTPPALHASTHAIAVHASFTGVVAGMGTTAVIRADNGGTIGNSVVLTFNGLAELFTVIGDWNSNNPSNTITLVSGNTADVPDNGETITLTGGINGGSDVVTPASIGAAVIGTGADNAQGAQRGVLTKGNFEAFEINEFNNAIFKTSNTGDGCIGIETYTGAARTGFCLLGSRGANAFMQGGSSTFRIEKSGGTLADLNASRVVAASGTLTASAPVLDLSQTWNNAAATFTGLRFNITNTASAAGSLYESIQLAGDQFYELAASRAVRLYNTSSSLNANHERGFMRWSSNVLQIGTEKAGTGSARPLEFQTDGVTRMTIGSGGAVTMSDNNTMVFRTSATKFTTLSTNATGGGLTLTYTSDLNSQNAEYGIFVAGGPLRVTGADGYGNSILASGRISCSSVIQCTQIGSVQNGNQGWTFAAAMTASSGVTSVTVPFLRLAGATNLFPALKRSSTTLQVRLANDSAFAPFAAGLITATGNLVLTDNDGAQTATFDAQSKLTANRTYDLPDASGVIALTNGSINLWIPASALIPRTTNGCGVDSRETATNRQNFDELLFDAGTDEFAQALIEMPSNYNNGTITARFYWTASSGSGDVIWGIQGRAFADDDALDTAAGTAQTVTDTLLAANDMHVSSATSAVTLGGTPAANTPIQFQIYRDADAAGDTLAVDARLLGVEIIYTAA